ncbi:pseudouridine synthase [Myxococcus stipitatus]|uniref:pseudouridine synthase n=1 Tax=Myxococcus stipitatus TaxID=83455 RepID=UPI001F28D761|nr:pseudouridine synthase [Myxococcus stipitatus]MCE9673568.1 pseudouridine synthase [Myxococcus stipitatus]
MAQQKVQVPREAAGERLDRFLTKHVPGFTPEQVRALIDSGAVRIRGKKCQPTRKLWGGEEIEIERPEPRAAPAASIQGPTLPVLHDDAALVIVDKPAGLVVEPEGRMPSVVGLLATQRPPFDVEGLAQPGVVHRLDRETSGCLAFARTDAAAAGMLRAFQEKQVDKRYWTLVLGNPPESIGRIGAQLRAAGWCRGAKKGRWRVTRGLCAGPEQRPCRPSGHMLAQATQAGQQQSRPIQLIAACAPSPTPLSQPGPGSPPPAPAPPPLEGAFGDIGAPVPDELGLSKLPSLAERTVVVARRQRCCSKRMGLRRAESVGEPLPKKGSPISKVPNRGRRQQDTRRRYLEAEGDSDVPTPWRRSSQGQPCSRHGQSQRH